MGLFHDKCTVIVDALTNEPLTGAELEEARIQQSKFFGGHTLSSGRKWKICGNSVSKKARVCSECGSRAPGGWIKCPVCHKWIGNEDRYCPHCNHPLYPEERTDFAGGIWRHDPGLFAQRFEIEDAAPILKQGIHVQEGTVAVLIDSGKEAGVLGPGRHNPDGTLRKINWFGNPPPRSVLMVDSGDIILKLDVPELDTAEQCRVSMSAEVTIRFVPGRADDFIANLLKDARSISYDAVAEWIKSECTYAAKNLCTQASLDDLVRDPNRRTMFEDELGRTVRDLFKRVGLELIRVGAVDFWSAEYSDLSEKYGNLEHERRAFEFNQKLMELVNSKEVAEIRQSLDKAQRDSDYSEEIKAIADGKADAETRRRMANAKREFDLEEYTEQLAQEKGIAASERQEEIEILRRVMRGNLSSKDAELALVSIQERHAQEMASLANKLELDQTMANYNREEQLRNAHHAAELDDIRRDEAIKNAKNEAVVYGIVTIEKAKADGEVTRIKTDAETYEALKWVEVKKAKQDLEIEAEERRLANKLHEETTRAEMIKGMSPLELAALSNDPNARADFLKYANQLLQTQMSPEQILATLTGTSSASVEALKAMYQSKDTQTQTLLDEVKKMYENSLSRDDKMMERYGQLLNNLSGMMANTASIAAARTDFIGTNAAIQVGRSSSVLSGNGYVPPPPPAGN